MDGDLQVAAVAAVSALLGSAIGGLIPAAVEAWKLHQAEKKDEAKELAAFHKGARLLSAQLETLSVSVEYAREYDFGSMMSAWPMDVDSWQSYQHVFAAHLDRERWEAVAGAVELVTVMKALRKNRQSQKNLYPREARELHSAKVALDEAITALKPWQELPDSAALYAPPISAAAIPPVREGSGD